MVLNARMQWTNDYDVLFAEKQPDVCRLELWYIKVYRMTNDYRDLQKYGKCTSGTADVSYPFFHITFYHTFDW